MLAVRWQKTLCIAKRERHDTTERETRREKKLQRRNEKETATNDKANLLCIIQFYSIKYRCSTSRGVCTINTTTKATSFSQQGNNKGRPERNPDSTLKSGVKSTRLREKYQLAIYPRVSIWLEWLCGVTEEKNTIPTTSFPLLSSPISARYKS